MQPKGARWDEEGWEESQGGEMYILMTESHFLYDRNQHNVIKQLSSNLKTKKQAVIIAK